MSSSRSGCMWSSRQRSGVREEWYGVCVLVCAPGLCDVGCSSLMVVVLPCKQASNALAVLCGILM